MTLFRRKNSNDELFEVLVKNYQALVLYVIKGFLSEPADIEEAQSRAWSEVSAVIGRFSALEEKDRKNLLCTIARRRAVDVYREQQKHEHESLEDVSQYISTHSDDRLAADIALSIAAMKDADRELLLLRYKFGYSIDELSDIYKCGAAAMYKRIGRAKKRLAELLAEDGIDV